MKKIGYRIEFNAKLKCWELNFYTVAGGKRRLATGTREHCQRAMYGMDYDG